MRVKETRKVKSRIGIWYSIDNTYRQDDHLSSFTKDRQIQRGWTRNGVGWGDCITLRNVMNAIFQYLVLHDFLDEIREPIDGVPRSEIYKQITERSVQSFRWYANQINAEHIFTDSWWFPKAHSSRLNEDENFRLLKVQPFFEILRVIYDEQFDKYEKVLVADIDIIANTKENIFDQSNCDFYGVYESDVTEHRGVHIYNPWDKDDDAGRKMLKFMTKHYLDNGYPVHPVMPPNNPSKFMNTNTGMFVMTKKARLIAREKFTDWKIWVENNVTKNNPLWFYVDQFFINAEIMKHNIDYEGIDQKWNLGITNYGNDELALEYGNFLHYSGGTGRPKLFKHLEEKRFIWS